jgi:hypothetical protein
MSEKENKRGLPIQNPVECHHFYSTKAEIKTLPEMTQEANASNLELFSL